MSWCSGSSRWPSKTLSARVSGRPSRRRTTARLRSMVSYTFAATSAVDSIVIIADVLRPRGPLLPNKVCHQLSAPPLDQDLDDDARQQARSGLAVASADPPRGGIGRSSACEAGGG